jgi:hypothetical protein
VTAATPDQRVLSGATAVIATSPAAMAESTNNQRRDGKRGTCAARYRHARAASST